MLDNIYEYQHWNTIFLCAFFVYSFHFIIQGACFQAWVFRSFVCCFVVRQCTRGVNVCYVIKCASTDIYASWAGLCAWIFTKIDLVVLVLKFCIKSIDGSCRHLNVLLCMHIYNFCVLCAHLGTDLHRKLFGGHFAKLSLNSTQLNSNSGWVLASYSTGL